MTAHDPDAELAARRARADEQLRLAIIEHADAHWYANPETEMLSEFVVVGAWQPTVENGTSVYSLHARTTNTPGHIYRGLLHEGLACIDAPQRTDDGD